MSSFCQEYRNETLLKKGKGSLVEKFFVELDSFRSWQLAKSFDSFICEVSLLFAWFLSEIESILVLQTKDVN